MVAPVVSWPTPMKSLIPILAKAAAEASKETYGKALANKGFRAITTEILESPAFFFAEDYHQQYLAKVPHGYCGLGGTGVKIS